MKATTSEPLLILGFEADASLAKELALSLADFGVAREILDRKFEADALADALAVSELVIIAIARPESVGADVSGLVDRVVAARGHQRVIMATPQGTYSAALLELDRKHAIPLFDLGRRLEPGSAALTKLRKRVAVALIAAQPLDLPASLYATAIQQRSIAILAANPSTAASRPLRDWELVRAGEAGVRPSPLWSSWLRATHPIELARLATHLDELRVHALIGGGSEPREAKR